MTTDALAASQYRAKVYQMLFHWLSASMTCLLLPKDYLDNPIQATEDRFSSGVMESPPLAAGLLYLTATTYNCVLYFWDPVESTHLRVYHCISLLLGALFSWYDMTKWLMMVLGTVYALDTYLFMTEYKSCDHSSLKLRAMMKIHHMATIMLLILSWKIQLFVYGLFILFIHDVTDVSMFALRLQRQSSPKTTLDFRIVFTIVALLLSWSYYRIYRMGVVTYGLAYHLNDANMMHIKDQTAGVALCVAGLSVLWVFNVYWTGLVAHKVYLVAAGKANAERDDNE